MNKELLIRSISETLRGNFENLKRSSQKTRSDGNDAESKSEGKYDTRSIEENYLADGFARQARAAAEAAVVCENMNLQSFGPDSPIDLSALVHVGFSGESAWFFLAPAGGGTEVAFEERTVTVLTPDSPLGRELMGKKSGDRTKSPASRILAVE